MNRIKRYFQESFNELIHKVTWPTWPELQNSSIIVLVASFIIAIIVFLMDFSFGKVIKAIYSMFY